MEISNLTTSVHHAMSNDGKKRVNHIIVQTPSTLVKARQNNWNEHLTHIEPECNDVASSATGLASNEVPPMGSLAETSHFIRVCRLI